MKIINVLASQLDREATQFELSAVQKIFTENIEFWSLCMDAKRLLIDEQSAKKEEIKYASDIK